MDGGLAVLVRPHASRQLQRRLGELDADLLVLEQLPERVTELGGVVKQARPRVRLPRQASSTRCAIAGRCPDAKRRCDTAVVPTRSARLVRSSPNPVRRTQRNVSPDHNE